MIDVRGPTWRQSKLEGAGAYKLIQVASGGGHYEYTILSYKTFVDQECIINM